ncbi:MAG: HAMP domain-containing sensor histidine kinase [Cyanobacteriota bacterium]|nr:HAMP domain-containing sensor histidine kinase [Cyanobacteriota bacterium]
MRQPHNLSPLSPPTQPPTDMNLNRDPLVSGEQVAALLHEVRNPLTTLQTLAKLLKKRLPAGDPNQWIGNSMEQECQHLQALLERFEASLGSERPLQLQIVYLQEILPDWIATYEALAHAHHIHFQSQLTEAFLQALPAVWVDLLALKQVLGNLVDNACKYTPPGGSVSLGVAVQSDGVIVSIQDSGDGISPEHLAHIFEPFYRAESATPGQGLGLAISRDLVEGMQGCLEVESQLHQGTTFRVKVALANTDQTTQLRDDQPD